METDYILKILFKSRSNSSLSFSYSYAKY